MRTGSDSNDVASDSRVNCELALGYDPDFESQWWHIEIAIWIGLSIVVFLSLSGFLGRGPLAHLQRGSCVYSKK
jgi:hypothetical protein